MLRRKIASLALGIFSCSLLILGGTAFAAPKNGEHGASPRCFGPNAKMNRPYQYNPASSTMVKGTVESVDSVNYPDGPMVHIKVNTPEGMMMVVLGPSYYYNRSNIALQAGDKVEIAGSSVYVNGDEVIIATEVSKNGKTLQLRDSHGNPFWRKN